MRIFWGTMALIVGCLGVSCKKKAKLDLKLNDVSTINLGVLGSKPAPLPDIYYDPDLYAFASEYINDAKIRGVEVSTRTIEQLRIIKWVDTLSVGEGAGVMAACSRYYVTAQSFFFQTTQVVWTMIEVLRSKTLRYTGGDRILLRELMYHELGHCLLEQPHLPEGVEGIMSAVFVEGSHRALKTWPQLVDDNFSPAFLKMLPPIGGN